jgi:MerR family redox-sensitive transcriptional activator SoxR
MAGLLIGDVAKRFGLNTSAIRYYERAGLLPPPARASGQRRYEAQAIGRLRIIQVARRAGFSIAETRVFLTGFSPATGPNARWRALAERKVAELNAQAARMETMKSLLESSFRCDCRRIEDCERLIARCDARAGTRAKHASTRQVRSTPA